MARRRSGLKSNPISEIWRRMTRCKTETILREEQKEEQKDGSGLKKVLSFWHVFLFGIANTVGSGIFVTPGTAAKDYAGPALFISFMIAGLACGLSGICYADFSSRLPASGGAYSYVYSSLGEYLGFLSGMCLTLEYGVSSAAIARGFAGYLRELIEACGVSVPSFLQEYAVNGSKVLVLDLLPPLLCIAVAALCMLGVRESAWVSSLMTVGNVSMILFIIIAGLPYFDSDHFSDFAPRGAAGILGGASSVFFSYVGWDAVCVLSEEVEKPTVVIPRAIGVTISLTATLYALVSISLIGLVGVEQINPLTPIYSAFQYVGLDWAAIVVAVAAVTCSITATYGTSAGQPRVFYRMGKDGLLSPKFTKVNSKGSPFYGIFWTLILTVIISALLDFDILNQAISAGILLMQGLVCIGCVLRRIRRGMPTPSTTSVYDKVDKQARIFLGALVIDLIIAGLCLQGGSGSEIAVYVFLCIYAAGLVAFFYRGWRLMGTNVFSLIVPIAAVTVNIFIMASLGWLAFCIVLAYFVAGSVIYFGYGIRHSTMNGLRLSEVDGLDVEMDDIIKMASRSIDGDSGVGGDDKGLNDTLN